MEPRDKATLILDNQSLDLPLLPGSHHQRVIDIKPLAATGVYTFDPGFLATASCQSTITHIDGQAGKLRYRGYDVDALAQNYPFAEVGYCLINGELPTRSQATVWNQSLQRAQPQVAGLLESAFQTAPSHQHPMGILTQAWSLLAALEQDQFDPHRADYLDEVSARMIGAAPLLAGLCMRQHLDSDRVIYSGRSDNYAALALTALLRHVHGPDHTPDPILVKAFDTILTIHADHEQNASTSVVRMVASTGANPMACLAAGCASLWGPAHGGANEACLSMLQTIGSEDQVDTYIAKAKDKEDPFRLMGFGHRVYKNFDPRATLMRELCPEVLEATGQAHHPLFKLARTLEKIALEDDYFVSRNLYPNVDFYSGITLSAMGIPKEMFTVIFALARTTGWVAHWLEWTQGSNKRIARPRQLYTGAQPRECPPSH